MSVILLAATLFAADLDQSTGMATGRRTHEPVRHSQTYPDGDLLAGQPNRFPGVDWQSVEVRNVGPDAFPGVDWQAAGVCQGPDNTVGYVYRAFPDVDDRPTEEVAFTYQKITWSLRDDAAPNIGSSGQDGVRQRGDGGQRGQRRGERMQHRQQMGQVQGQRSQRLVTSVQWPYQVTSFTIDSSNHCPN